MKRSEINAQLRAAEIFFAHHHFHLPPVARWTPEDWRHAGPDTAELAEVGIGWDLTDFGRGNFAKEGLLLFTIRNGKADDPGYRKPYAEKIMIVREGQLTITHHHIRKTEDIINRGGGRLLLVLHNSTPDGGLADTEVRVVVDGRLRVLPPAAIVALSPGESITLEPGLWHSFWGEQGAGDVLVGEVSSVNDDRTDNRFLGAQLRFPEIEEDEPPYRLLVSDYPK